MENAKGFKASQYACAVLLIVSSIALVAYQVVEIDDVAGGLLYYVAQSFLLAGSIFGLDQYIRIIKSHTDLTDPTDSRRKRQMARNHPEDEKSVKSVESV